MNLILTSDTHYGHSRKTHDIHKEFLDRMHEAVISKGVKALLIAGDIASARQKQLERSLTMFREKFPTLPIIVVFGNHDFWEIDHYDGKKFRFPAVMHRHHKQILLDLNISHARTEVVIEDVIFCGFDGWYRHPNPPTNDLRNMPESWGEDLDVHQAFRIRADNEFGDTMNLDVSKYRKAVCMTHFPPFPGTGYGSDYSANPAYYKPLTDKFDALCVGHSHTWVNIKKGKCGVYNCGSDYDDPQFLEFEV